ncbi:MAG: GatB/YqeY domain-containing protein [Candidatus Magasanikbacteria bacterium]
MSLIDTIKQNQLEARKNQNKERLSVMQVVLSALKNESIAKQKELSDDEVIVVLQKQVKQLNDAMKDFVAGKRQDLVDQTTKEISVISEFLPAQMSQEDVEKEVQQIIAEFGEVSPSDFGKVMGLAMSKLKGKADGNVVSESVKKNLTK